MTKIIIIALLISNALISKDYKNGKKIISEKPLLIEYETSRDFYYYNYETCSCHKKYYNKKGVKKWNIL